MHKNGPNVVWVLVSIGHYWGKLNNWSKVATMRSARLGGYYAYAQARSIYLSLKGVCDRAQGCR